MKIIGEFEYGDELPLLAGGISALPHPYDLLDDDVIKLEQELAEKLARKRQPGFTAPWREEERKPKLRRIA